MAIDVLRRQVLVERAEKVRAELDRYVLGSLMPSMCKEFDPGPSPEDEEKEHILEAYLMGLEEFATEVSDPDLVPKSAHQDELDAAEAEYDGPPCPEDEQDEEEYRDFMLVCGGLRVQAAYGVGRAGLTQSDALAYALDEPLDVLDPEAGSPEGWDSARR